MPMQTPFPEGMPIRKGPTQLPTLAPSQGVWGDVGQGMQQAGSDIDAYQVREAKLKDMVEKRQMAQQVQAAKEEMFRTDMEFNEAKKAQEQAQFEAGETRKGDEFGEKQALDEAKNTREQAARDREDLMDTRVDTFSDKIDAREAANLPVDWKYVQAQGALMGIGETKRFNQFLKSRFPEKFKTDFIARDYSKGVKDKEVAKNKIALFEEQIIKVDNELQGIRNAKLGHEIRVTDPISGETTMQVVNSEERRQQLLAGPTKEKRRLQRDLIDARATVGGKAAEVPDNTTAVLEQINILKAQMAEKRAKLGL